MKYRAILESAEHYSLTAINGGDVTPLTVEEMAMFEAATSHPDSR